MLTQLVENGRIKCEKYWPDKDEEEDFGIIHVTCLHVWSCFACMCVCVCVCVSVCVREGGGVHKKLHDEVSLVLFHSQLLLFTCLHCRSNTFKTLLLCEPCA